MFAICLNPIKSNNNLLPLETRITEVSYPPRMSVHKGHYIRASYTTFDFQIKYEMENPNNETINILQGC